MLTQFLGSYLLYKNYVDMQQLQKTLQHQKSSHTKIGTLAVNAGYLTDNQVEELHNIQKSQDKKIGDIAIQLGYLSDKQVQSLLAFQRSSHLSLGQALIKHGLISSDDFEKALSSYMRSYCLTDLDFCCEKGCCKAKGLIEQFYNYTSHNQSDILTKYTCLLMKNLVRFIGIDFIPIKSIPADSYNIKNYYSQDLTGDFTVHTYISGDDSCLLNFAERYLQKEFSKKDTEYKNTISDFINLQNNLFCKALLNSNQNLSLSKIETHQNENLTLKNNFFVIPIEFPFGKLEFIIGL